MVDWFQPTNHQPAGRQSALRALLGTRQNPATTPSTLVDAM